VHLLCTNVSAMLSWLYKTVSALCTVHAILKNVQQVYILCSLTALNPFLFLTVRNSRIQTCIKLLHVQMLTSALLSVTVVITVILLDFSA
jgi:hypothetical protein